MKDKTILVIAGIFLVGVLIAGSVDITGAWGWPSRLSRCHKCYSNTNVVKLLNNCTTLQRTAASTGNTLCYTQNRTCVASMKINASGSFFIECSKEISNYPVMESLSAICCLPNIF